MSAPSVVSSQSLTVPRNESIITLTPTITLTATVSAAGYLILERTNPP